jgi:hypothetical protein
MINWYIISVESPERKISCGRSTHEKKDNTKRENE